MAIRNVDTNLWSDGLIMDNFGMLEKYFWLFLLTTRYGDLSGCFEITQKQIQLDASLTPKQVDDLITRFIELKLIDYDYEKNELLIVNYLKYNFNRSPKFIKAVEKYANKIKNQSFKEYIYNVLENEGEAIGYEYGMHAVGIPLKDKDKVKDKVKDKDKDKELLKEKKTFGDFNNVLLTFDEIQKLQDYFYNDFQRYIEKLDLYIESSGKKYKSHYATIRQWLIRDGIKPNELIIAEFDDQGNLLNG